MKESTAKKRTRKTIVMNGIIHFEIHAENAGTGSKEFYGICVWLGRSSELCPASR